MYQIGDDGNIAHLGKAPTSMTAANFPSASPHTHSASCSHTHSHTHTHTHTPSSSSSSSSSSVIQLHPSQQPVASLMHNLNKRQQLQDGVFQPCWTQPTETLDEYVDRMMPHSISGGGNEPTAEDLEDEAAEKEEKEEKDDEEYLAEKRYWDEFNDDNPTGIGNRLRQG
jgi:hypothetical protein